MRIVFLRGVWPAAEQSVSFEFSLLGLQQKCITFPSLCFTRRGKAMNCPRRKIISIGKRSRWSVAALFVRLFRVPSVPSVRTFLHCLVEGTLSPFKAGRNSDRSSRYRRPTVQEKPLPRSAKGLFSRLDNGVAVPLWSLQRQAELFWQNDIRTSGLSQSCVQ